MRKAAHYLDGVDSLNPCRWRGKRLHHHGGGVCWLFVLLWMDSWRHELIVCKKWYKNNLKMRLTELLFDPPRRAPHHLTIYLLLCLNGILQASRPSCTYNRYLCTPFVVHTSRVQWYSSQQQLRNSMMNEQSGFNAEQIKKDLHPGSETVWLIIDQQVITRGRLCLSQSSPLSPKTYAWLLVPKLTAHFTSFALKWEETNFPIKVFSSLSHADSSFVGVSDVSRINCNVHTYFLRT